MQAEVETDLDLRMTDLWTEALSWPTTNFTLSELAQFIRAAYCMGHVAAMTEVDPSMLYKKHGYRVPQRGETPCSNQ